MLDFGLARLIVIKWEPNVIFIMMINNQIRYEKRVTYREGIYKKRDYIYVISIVIIFYTSDVSLDTDQNCAEMWKII